MPVHLHPEVEVTVTINVARSADEAERLARGENVTIRREGGAEEDEAEAVKVAAEAFFEPGAAEAQAEGKETTEEAAKEAAKQAPAKA